MRTLSWTMATLVFVTYAAAAEQDSSGICSEEKAEGFGINQGFIELSNVNAISVMLEMIEVLRGYESYKKVIQSVDDVTSKAINEVGQLA